LDRRLPAKLHTVAGVERLVPRAFDVREVDPYVGRGVARRDATPALLGVEKLHGALADISNVLKRRSPRFVAIR
jgi:hypothetical protein